MSVNTFRELCEHVGHNVECVTYGDPAVNVALECMDCKEVLVDFDNKEDEL